MKCSPTRMAGSLLAFGFFFFCSCTPSLQTIEESESTFREGNPRSALAGVNRILEEEPQNEEALFLKAEILSELAGREQAPERRLSYYREMNQTLAAPQVEPTVRFQNRRDRLIRRAWSREQEEGLRLLQQNHNPEALRQGQRITAHFENAILINPDSSVTYSLKATTHYSAGQLSHAIETLETGRNRIPSFPVDYSEKLAFLYLEEGDIERSAALYRELLEENPDHHSLRYGLVNALILAEHHHQSVPILRELATESPDNIDYLESLATELISLAANYSDSLMDLHMIPEEDARTVIQTLDESEEVIENLLERHPNPDEFTFTAAALYKNAALKLLNLADASSDSLSDTFRAEAMRMLQNSLPLWEAVAERNPENREIWRSLYQIYTQLGMSEEAESTRSRINL